MSDREVQLCSPGMFLRREEGTGLLRPGFELRVCFRFRGLGFVQALGMCFVFWG